MKHWKTLFIAVCLLLTAGALDAHEHGSEGQARTGFSGLVEAGGQCMNIRKKRKEHSLSAMAMNYWNAPLGLHNSFVHLGAGLEKTNANIDFYDEDVYFSFMGLG